MTPILQATFGAALLDPSRPAPRGVRAWNGSDVGVRFAVYRNNVVSSLAAALADTFPVVRELVGAEFFDAMARAFVATRPPTSPVLAEYGEALPRFVDDFAPAATLPYLADVARLELARLQAFHAADATSLSTAAVAAAAGDGSALGRARPRLHPSLRVLRSRFAAASIWRAHQGHLAFAAVDPLRPEAALVLRTGADVVVIPVAHASAAFVQRLAAGDTVAGAVTHAGASASAADADGEAFDLSLTLGLLIGHGAFTAWHEPATLP